ncbi:flagellar filament capping protein FliD [Desulfovibrio sp. OttesenSCG-928-O18]|nr:flagellar filament capping protein FliD [Desulfovibrio sp. OttesenSCG-928-O18]
MATYTSGSITFSGLSGVDVDFDDLVDKLYQIESMQADKLVEWYSDWEIRRDAFTQVRESLVTMQSALSAINSVDTFLVKTASSSNESVVGATVSSEAAAGNYTVEVGQLATSSVWSIDTGLSTKDAVVNNSGSEGAFTYTYKGESRTIRVPSGTNLEQLKNLINNDGENLGVRVQLIQSGDEIVFQLSGLDTGASASLSIDDTTNLNGLDLQQTAKWTYASDGSGGYVTNELTSWVTYASTSEAINTTETPKTFEFDVNGESYSVKLAAGGSLADLAAAINAKTAESGVTAQIATFTHSGTGEQYFSLHLSTTNSSDLLTVGGGTLEGYDSMIDTTNWQVQQGQNAEIRVQGWPATGWLEVSSNTVSDVVDGVSFNLRAEGKATVSVELDTDAIEKNVQTFVDAVNQFRSLIMDLTKVEEDTGIDPEYAENQSEMQNGNALTGNYGVQLLTSNLKQAVAGSAKGFSYLQEIEGKMYGDMFTSLSQIGIITDTNESSPTFGLLVINTATEKDGVSYMQSTATMTLKEALAKDAESVARLFAADGEAKSNSSAFGVNSTVKSITEPGTYDVSYTTDSSGNISSATINGKDAKVNGNEISLSRTPESSNSSVASVSYASGDVEYLMEVEVNREATTSSTLIETLLDKADSINDTGSPIDFSYSFNGETRTFEIEDGTTLNDLVAGINKDPGNLGVTASLVPTTDDPPKYNLKLEAKNSGANSTIATTATGGTLATPLPTTATAGQNAEYRYRNVANDPNAAWSAWTQSETNAITVDSRFSMTIHGAGTATLKAPKHNDADGIVLDVYDLTPNKTVTGTVSVREGKINELLNMLGGTEGILGSEGTLAILENNYDEIMANIKDKIQKEDERLNKWLRLTRQRFARLETTLSEYKNLESSIQSQIEQLGNNS